MCLVIKWDGQKEVGVNSDGSTSSPENAELYRSAFEANKVVDKHYGSVIPEGRYFGDAK